MQHHRIRDYESSTRYSDGLSAGELDPSHLYSRKRPLPSRRHSFDETASKIKREPLNYEETEEMCQTEKTQQTEHSHGYEEFEQFRTAVYPLPNNIRDDLDFENILATLKLLMTLEDYLGSLGPKVVDLMTIALKMEKEKVNSSKGLLDSVSAVVLIEAAKEKLIGAVQAGLVPQHATSVACLAVMRTAATLHEADKHLRVLLQAKLGREKETKSVSTETEPWLSRPLKSSSTESHKNDIQRNTKNTSLDQSTDLVDGSNIGSWSKQQTEGIQQLSLQELELLLQNYQNLPQDEQHGLKQYLTRLKEGPLPKGGRQLLQSFNHIFQEPVKIHSAKKYIPATREEIRQPTLQLKNMDYSDKSPNKSLDTNKSRTKKSLTQETSTKKELGKNVSSIYDKLTKEKTNYKLLEYIQHIESVSTKGDNSSRKNESTTDRCSKDCLNTQKSDADQVKQQYHTRKLKESNKLLESTNTSSMYNFRSQNLTTNTQIADKKDIVVENSGKMKERITFEEHINTESTTDHPAKPEKRLSDSADMKSKKKPSVLGKIKLTLQKQIQRPRVRIPLPKLGTCNVETASSSKSKIGKTVDSNIRMIENLQMVDKVKEKVASTDKKDVQSESYSKQKNKVDKSKLCFKQGCNSSKITNVSQAYNSAKDSLDIRPPSEFRVNPERIKTNVIAIPVANTLDVISCKKIVKNEVKRRSRNAWNIRKYVENIIEHDSDTKEIFDESHSQLKPSIIRMFLPRKYNIDDIDECESVDQQRLDLDSTKDMASKNDETNNISSTSSVEINKDCENKSDNSVDAGSTKRNRKRRGKPRCGKGSKTKQIIGSFLRLHVDDSFFIYHPSRCPNIYMKNYFAKQSTTISFCDILDTNMEKKTQLGLLASCVNIHQTSSELCHQPIVSYAQNICDGSSNTFCDQPNEITASKVVQNSGVQPMTSLNRKNSFNEQPIQNTVKKETAISDIGESYFKECLINMSQIKNESKEQNAFENVDNDNMPEHSHCYKIVNDPVFPNVYDENETFVDTKTALISSTISSPTTLKSYHEVVGIPVENNLYSVTDIQVGGPRGHYVQEYPVKPKIIRVRKKRKTRNRSGSAKRRMRQLKRLQELERNAENLADSNHPIETSNDVNVKTEPGYYNAYDENGTSIEIENTCVTLEHFATAALNSIQNSNENLCGENENQLVNSQTKEIEQKGCFSPKSLNNNTGSVIKREILEGNVIFSQSQPVTENENFKNYEHNVVIGITDGKKSRSSTQLGESHETNIQENLL